MDNKPARLRVFDKDTKSKAIIDVYWSHLKGNKQPYLSTSIVDVKVNNKTVHGWDKQKTAILSLSKDMYTLLKLHLCNLDGTGDNNISYHFSQCKKYFGQTVYTQEQYNKDCSVLKDAIKNHKIFKRLEKPCFRPTIKILNKLASAGVYDLPFYLNKYDALFIMQPMRHIVSNSEYRIVQSLVEDYLGVIKKYSTLTVKYQYKSLPSEKEVITPAGLATMYDMGILEVYEILATPFTEQKLKPIIDKVTQDRKKELVRLTVKYNIPTITQ